MNYHLKIRVNAVAPGTILFQPFHTPNVRARTLKRIPKKVLGQPIDIAEAIIFLSEKASYATGEILVIDGGRSIVPESNFLNIPTKTEHQIFAVS